MFFSSKKRTLFDFPCLAACLSCFDFGPLKKVPQLLVAFLFKFTGKFAADLDLRVKGEKRLINDGFFVKLLEFLAKGAVAGGGAVAEGGEEGRGREVLDSRPPIENITYINRRIKVAETQAHDQTPSADQRFPLP